MSCHNSDPFIHDPWIDNAKLSTESNETVVPKFEYDGLNLPYFAVGGYGSEFSNASVHIEGNNCLSCHRSSMELAVNTFDNNGNVLVNEFMPPYDHGSLNNDYNELIECFLNSPENTQNCNWLIPPGGDCNSEIISSNQINNGDVNNDGLTNISDVIQIIDLILNDEYLNIADLNSDNSINVLDIIELLNIILNNVFF